MVETKIRVFYTTYSPILKRSFQDFKDVKNLGDFRLFAYAIFSGNWKIDRVEKL